MTVTEKAMPHAVTLMVDSHVLVGKALLEMEHFVQVCIMSLCVLSILIYVRTYVRTIICEPRKSTSSGLVIICLCKPREIIN